MSSKQLVLAISAKLAELGGTSQTHWENIG
jgi:hypothetical protein